MKKINKGTVERLRKDSALLARPDTLRIGAEAFAGVLADIDERYYRGVMFAAPVDGVDVIFSNPRLMPGAGRASVVAFDGREDGSVFPQREYLMDRESSAVASEMAANIIGQIESALVREKEQNRKKVLAASVEAALEAAGHRRMADIPEL